MMTIQTIVRRLAVSAVVLSASVACAAEPWATAVPFEPYHSFDAITIPNADAAVYHDLKFPAVKKKPATRTVLRFRSRLHFETPSGWNYYLGINLNGQQAHGYTPNGTPRILNRDAQVTLDEGEPYTWPWWNTLGGAKHVDLLTFFGPGGDVLDKRIKSDRDELYWFVIDVDDLVNYYKTVLDMVVIANEKNRLRLSNGLLHRFVKGAEVDLIIDDLQLGAIPDEAWKQQTLRFIARVPSLTDPIVLRRSDIELKIGRDGAMHVIRDGKTFGIDSRFSYPGDEIGYNHFGGETDWTVSVARKSDREAQVKASCPMYDLKRRVFFDDDRVRIHDTFTNKLDEPLGIDVRHRFTTDEPLTECLLGGVPEMARAEMTENPTLFMNAGKAALGVIVEDNVTRLNVEAFAQPNRAVVRNASMGLRPSAEYTAELTLYPMAGGTDWWKFVNRVRRDWNIQFTIDGPWDFFHVQQKRHLIKDPDRLRAYLKRKNLKIVALMPWLDYENYDPDTGGLVDRDKYKRLITEAAAALRAADPTVKVTGCMESFPISLPLDEVATLVERLPNKQQGYPKVKAHMLEGLGSLTERDRECLFVSRDGDITCEVYYRGKGTGIPLGGFAAYPAVGNAQHERLMEQAKFIKETCGLDGIYIDCFSLAYESNMSHLRYDYRKWDGHTVNLDPATGRIADMYTDAGLVGATSRKALIEYVLQDNGVFVANSYPAVRETQSLPTFRFSESEYNFNPLSYAKGEEPPLFYRMTGSQLSTSIGLGYRTVRLRPNDKGNEAQIIMKTVVTYLRYGGLFYHYNTNLPAGTAYGPINYMFPITPVELGKGFVVGKERIITAVAGTFEWLHKSKPRVMVFDMKGHEVAAPVKVSGNQVTIEIENWERVAVVEPAES